MKNAKFVFASAILVLAADLCLAESWTIQDVTGDIFPEEPNGLI